MVKSVSDDVQQASATVAASVGKNKPVATAVNAAAILRQSKDSKQQQHQQSNKTKKYLPSLLGRVTQGNASTTTGNSGGVARMLLNPFGNNRKQQQMKQQQQEQRDDPIEAPIGTAKPVAVNNTEQRSGVAMKEAEGTILSMDQIGGSFFEKESLSKLSSITNPMDKQNYYNYLQQQQRMVAAEDQPPLLNTVIGVVTTTNKTSKQKDHNNSFDLSTLSPSPSVTNSNERMQKQVQEIGNNNNDGMQIHQSYSMPQPLRSKKDPEGSQGLPQTSRQTVEQLMKISNNIPPPPPVEEIDGIDFDNSKESLLSKVSSVTNPMDQQPLKLLNEQLTSLNNRIVVDSPFSNIYSSVNESKERKEEQQKTPKIRNDSNKRPISIGMVNNTDTAADLMEQHQGQWQQQGSQHRTAISAPKAASAFHASPRIMELNNGIKLEAPNPMSFNKVIIQSGKEILQKKYSEEKSGKTKQGPTTHNQGYYSTNISAGMITQEENHNRTFMQTTASAVPIDSSGSTKKKMEFDKVKALLDRVHSSKASVATTSSQPNSVVQHNQDAKSIIMEQSVKTEVIANGFNAVKRKAALRRKNSKIAVTTTTTIDNNNIISTYDRSNNNSDNNMMISTTIAEADDDEEDNDDDSSLSSRNEAEKSASPSSISTHDNNNIMVKDVVSENNLKTLLATAAVMNVQDDEQAVVDNKSEVQKLPFLVQHEHPKTPTSQRKQLEPPDEASLRFMADGRKPFDAPEAQSDVVTSPVSSPQSGDHIEEESHLNQNVAVNVDHPSSSNFNILDIITHMSKPFSPSSCNKNESTLSVVAATDLVASPEKRGVDPGDITLTRTSPQYMLPTPTSTTRTRTTENNKVSSRRDPEDNFFHPPKPPRMSSYGKIPIQPGKDVTRQVTYYNSSQLSQVIPIQDNVSSKPSHIDVDSTAQLLSSPTQKKDNDKVPLDGKNTVEEVVAIVLSEDNNVVSGRQKGFDETPARLSNNIGPRSPEIIDLNDPFGYISNATDPGQKSPEIIDLNDPFAFFSKKLNKKDKKKVKKRTDQTTNSVHHPQSSQKSRKKTDNLGDLSSDEDNDIPVPPIDIVPTEKTLSPASSRALRKKKSKIPTPIAKKYPISPGKSSSNSSSISKPFTANFSHNSRNMNMDTNNNTKHKLLQNQNSDIEKIYLLTPSPQERSVNLPGNKRELHSPFPIEIAMSGEDAVSDLDQSFRQFPLKHIEADNESIDISALDGTRDAEETDGRSRRHASKNTINNNNADVFLYHLQIKTNVVDRIDLQGQFVNNRSQKDDRMLNPFYSGMQHLPQIALADSITGEWTLDCRESKDNNEGDGISSSGLTPLGQMIAGTSSSIRQLTTMDGLVESSMQKQQDVSLSRSLTPLGRLIATNLEIPEQNQITNQNRFVSNMFGCSEYGIRNVIAHTPAACAHTAVNGCNDILSLAEVDVRRSHHKPPIPAITISTKKQQDQVVFLEDSKRSSQYSKSQTSAQNSTNQTGVLPGEYMGDATKNRHASMLIIVEGQAIPYNTLHIDDMNKGQQPVQDQSDQFLIQANNSLKTREEDGSIVVYESDPENISSRLPSHRPHHVTHFGQRFYSSPISNPPQDKDFELDVGHSLPGDIQKNSRSRSLENFATSSQHFFREDGDPILMITTKTSAAPPTGIKAPDPLGVEPFVYRKPSVIADRNLMMDESNTYAEVYSDVDKYEAWEDTPKTRIVSEKNHPLYLCSLDGTTSSDRDNQKFDIVSGEQIAARETRSFIQGIWNNSLDALGFSPKSQSTKKMKEERSRPLDQWDDCVDPIKQASSRDDNDSAPHLFSKSPIDSKNNGIAKDPSELKEEEQMHDGVSATVDDANSPDTNNIESQLSTAKKPQIDPRSICIFPQSHAATPTSDYATFKRTLEERIKSLRPTPRNQEWKGVHADRFPEVVPVANEDIEKKLLSTTPKRFLNADNRGKYDQAGNVRSNNANDMNKQTHTLKNKSDKNFLYNILEESKLHTHTDSSSDDFIDLTKVASFESNHNVDDAVWLFNINPSDEIFYSRRQDLSEADTMWKYEPMRNKIVDPLIVVPGKEIVPLAHYMTEVKINNDIQKDMLIVPEMIDESKSDVPGDLIIVPEITSSAEPSDRYSVLRETDESENRESFSTDTNSLLNVQPDTLNGNSSVVSYVSEQPDANGLTQYDENFVLSMSASPMLSTMTSQLQQEETKDDKASEEADKEEAAHRDNDTAMGIIMKMLSSPASSTLLDEASRTSYYPNIIRDKNDNDHSKHFDTTPTLSNIAQDNVTKDAASDSKSLQFSSMGSFHLSKVLGSTIFSDDDDFDIVDLRHDNTKNVGNVANKNISPLSFQTQTNLSFEKDPLMTDNLIIDTMKVDKYEHFDATHAEMPRRRFSDDISLSPAHEFELLRATLPSPDAIELDKMVNKETEQSLVLVENEEARTNSFGESSLDNTLIAICAGVEVLVCGQNEFEVVHNTLSTNHSVLSNEMIDQNRKLKPHEKRPKDYKKDSTPRYEADVLLEKQVDNQKVRNGARPKASKESKAYSENLILTPVSDIAKRRDLLDFLFEGTESFLCGAQAVLFGNTDTSRRRDTISILSKRKQTNDSMMQTHEKPLNARSNKEKGNNSSLKMREKQEDVDNTLEATLRIKKSDSTASGPNLDHVRKILELTRSDSFDDNSVSENSSFSESKTCTDPLIEGVEEIVSAPKSSTNDKIIPERAKKDECKNLLCAESQAKDPYMCVGNSREETHYDDKNDCIDEWDASDANATISSPTKTDVKDSNQMQLQRALVLGNCPLFKSVNEARLSDIFVLEEKTPTQNQTPETEGSTGASKNLLAPILETEENVREENLSTELFRREVPTKLGPKQRLAPTPETANTRNRATSEIASCEDVSNDPHTCVLNIAAGLQKNDTVRTAKNRRAPRPEDLMNESWTEQFDTKTPEGKFEDSNHYPNQKCRERSRLRLAPTPEGLRDNVDNITVESENVEGNQTRTPNFSNETDPFPNHGTCFENRSSVYSPLNAQGSFTAEDSDNEDERDGTRYEKSDLIIGGSSAESPIFVDDSISGQRNASNDNNTIVLLENFSASVEIFIKKQPVAETSFEKEKEPDSEQHHPKSIAEVLTKTDCIADQSREIIKGEKSQVPQATSTDDSVNVLNVVDQESTTVDLAEAAKDAKEMVEVESRAISQLQYDDLSAEVLSGKLENSSSPKDSSGILEPVTQETNDPQHIDINCATDTCLSLFEKLENDCSSKEESPKIVGETDANDLLEELGTRIEHTTVKSSLSMRHSVANWIINPKSIEDKIEKLVAHRPTPVVSGFDIGVEAIPVVVGTSLQITDLPPSSPIVRGLQVTQPIFGAANGGFRNEGICVAENLQIDQQSPSEFTLGKSNIMSSTAGPSFSPSPMRSLPVSSDVKDEASPIGKTNIQQSGDILAHTFTFSSEGVKSADSFETGSFVSKTSKQTTQSAPSVAQTFSSALESGSIPSRTQNESPLKVSTLTLDVVASTDSSPFTANMEKPSSDTSPFAPSVAPTLSSTIESIRARYDSESKVNGAESLDNIGKIELDNICSQQPFDSLTADVTGAFTRIREQTELDTESNFAPTFSSEGDLEPRSFSREYLGDVQSSDHAGSGEGCETNSALNIAVANDHSSPKARIVSENVLESINELNAVHDKALQPLLLTKDFENHSIIVINDSERERSFGAKNDAFEIDPIFDLSSLKNNSTDSSVQQEAVSPRHDDSNDSVHLPEATLNISIPNQEVGAEETTGTSKELNAPLTFLNASRFGFTLGTFFCYDVAANIYSDAETEEVCCDPCAFEKVNVTDSKHSTNLITVDNDQLITQNLASYFKHDYLAQGPVHNENQINRTPKSGNVAVARTNWNDMALDGYVNQPKSSYIDDNYGTSLADANLAGGLDELDPTLPVNKLTTKLNQNMNLLDQMEPSESNDVGVAINPILYINDERTVDRSERTWDPSTIDSKSMPSRVSFIEKQESPSVPKVISVELLAKRLPVEIRDNSTMTDMLQPIKDIFYQNMKLNPIQQSQDESSKSSNTRSSSESRDSDYSSEKPRIPLEIELIPQKSDLKRPPTDDIKENSKLRLTDIKETLLEDSSNINENLLDNSTLLNIETKVDQSKPQVELEKGANKVNTNSAFIVLGSQESAEFGDPKNQHNYNSDQNNESVKLGAKDDNSRAELQTSNNDKDVNNIESLYTRSAVSVLGPKESTEFRDSQYGHNHHDIQSDEREKLDFKDLVLRYDNQKKSRAELQNTNNDLVVKTADLLHDAPTFSILGPQESAELVDSQNQSNRQDIAFQSDESEKLDVKDLLVRYDKIVENIAALDKHKKILMHSHEGQNNSTDESIDSRLPREASSGSLFKGIFYNGPLSPIDLTAHDLKTHYNSPDSAPDSAPLDVSLNVQEYIDLTNVATNTGSDRDVCQTTSLGTETSESVDDSSYSSKKQDALLACPNSTEEPENIRLPAVEESHKADIEQVIQIAICTVISDGENSSQVDKVETELLPILQEKYYQAEFESRFEASPPFDNSQNDVATSSPSFENSGHKKLIKDSTEVAELESPAEKFVFENMGNFLKSSSDTEIQTKTQKRLVVKSDLDPELQKVQSRISPRQGVYDLFSRYHNIVKDMIVLDETKLKRIQHRNILNVSHDDNQDSTNLQVEKMSIKSSPARLAVASSISEDNVAASTQHLKDIDPSIQMNTELQQGHAMISPLVPDSEVYQVSENTTKEEPKLDEKEPVPRLRSQVIGASQGSLFRQKIRNSLKTSIGRRASIGSNSRDRVVLTDVEADIEDSVNPSFHEKQNEDKRAHRDDTRKLMVSISPVLNNVSSQQKKNTSPSSSDAVTGTGNIDAKIVMTTSDNSEDSQDVYNKFDKLFDARMGVDSSRKHDMIGKKNQTTPMQTKSLKENKILHFRASESMILPSIAISSPFASSVSNISKVRSGSPTPSEGTVDRRASSLTRLSDHRTSLAEATKVPELQKQSKFKALLMRRSGWIDDDTRLDGRDSPEMIPLTKMTIADVGYLVENRDDHEVFPAFSDTTATEGANSDGGNSNETPFEYSDDEFQPHHVEKMLQSVHGPSANVHYNQYITTSKQPHSNIEHIEIDSIIDDIKSRTTEVEDTMSSPRYVLSSSYGSVSSSYEESDVQTQQIESIMHGVSRTDEEISLASPRSGWSNMGVNSPRSTSVQVEAPRRLGINSPRSTSAQVESPRRSIPFNQYENRMNSPRSTSGQVESPRRSTPFNQNENRRSFH